MSITPNVFDMKTIPTAGKRFYKSLQIEDARNCEEILAAESGHSHYITKLKIQADAAMDVSIGSGETDSAVTTIHFGPLPFAAESGFWNWRAPRGKGIKCTSGLSIAIDSTATGTIWVEANGKSCKDWMTSNTSVSIVLSVDERKFIDAQAQRQDISRSAVVRHMILTEKRRLEQKVRKVKKRLKTRWNEPVWFEGCYVRIKGTSAILVQSDKPGGNLADHSRGKTAAKQAENKCHLDIIKVCAQS